MKAINNSALSVQSKVFGKLPDGREVSLVTLKNSNGLELDVTNYGGIITRLITPDAKGQPGDIVLVAGKGHETIQIIGAEQRQYDERGYLRQLVAEMSI